MNLAQKKRPMLRKKQRKNKGKVKKDKKEN